MQSPLQKAVGRPPHPICLDNSISSNRMNAPSQLSQPSLLNRVNTCDRVPKQPGPIAPSTMSPIGTSSNQAPPGIVRYGFPSYASYSHTDGRYAPGKLELAAFLASVGLVGSACADLLRDLLDVDALARLTSEQLFYYNVSAEKQLEIVRLLDARRLRLNLQTQQQPKKQVAPAVIRPPPGLGFAPAGDKLINPIGPNLGNATTKPARSPFPIGPPLYTPAVPISTSFPPSSNNNFLLSSVQTQPVQTQPVQTQHGSSNLTLPSLSAFDRPYVPSSEVAVMKSFDAGMSRPISIGSSFFSSNNTCMESEADAENRRIDEDLQQLGDQMVGSILDF